MLDRGKVLGILEDARAKIANPRDWWNGTSGCATEGNLCALIALPMSSTLENAIAHEAVADAMGVSEPSEIPEFNDSHTHAEVLAAFDRAIATVKAEMAPEPDPTPNADMALAVLEACESAGEVVARQIVSTRPELDFENVAEVAASELFYAAQDTAWVFEMGVKAGAVRS